MNIFAMVTTKASWEYTSYALKSFFRNTKLADGDRLYLIDNDNGFEEEASWFSPALEILKNESPQGFAANMNMIMDKALEKQADLFLLHNDIIFTSGWINPLIELPDSICSSISNANTDYDIPGFDWKAVMKLNQYLGREAKLKELVKLHHEKSEGFKKVLSLPFFCLRLPFSVFSKVGKLDESFLLAGGEDYDYCLRAYLEGFEVHYAKRSLVLHFAGKSSWAGAERPEQTAARNEQTAAVFEQKWGSVLKRFLLDNDSAAIEATGSGKQELQEENFKEFIKLCQS